MHAGMRLWLQHRFQGTETGSDIIHIHRAARIHHVDASCPITLHQLGLAGQIFRRRHMAHHQETHGIHAKLTSIGDMLFGDIGFGTVSGDTHHPRAGIIGILQIVNGANTRQQ
ncbi:hypothetical protein D3C81_2002900 [compost metagenome]